LHRRTLNIKINGLDYYRWLHLQINIFALSLCILINGFYSRYCNLHIIQFIALFHAFSKLYTNFRLWLNLQTFKPYFFRFYSFFAIIVHFIHFVIYFKIFKKFDIYIYIYVWIQWRQKTSLVSYKFIFPIVKPPY